MIPSTWCSSKILMVGAIALWVLSSTGGCYTYRHGKSYFPKGAINQPVGTFTRQWQSLQVEKAHENGLVLYEAAWVNHSDTLGPAAKQQLASLLEPDCRQAPLVTIEMSGDSALDELRKQSVVNYLQQLNPEFALQLNVKALRSSNVLYSEEATRVSREMMQIDRGGSLGNGIGNSTGGYFPGFSPPLGGL